MVDSHTDAIGISGLGFTNSEGFIEDNRACELIEDNPEGLIEDNYKQRNKNKMEQNIYYEGQVLWAQLDPNMHLRHSAYADFCAQARSNMLTKAGLSLEEFAKYHIGPILFREELVYHREIGLDERITVKVEMTKLNLKNFRFSFRHEIYKENGIKAATVEIDGAWLDLHKRKLTIIPDEWHSIFNTIPKADDYVETTG